MEKLKPEFLTPENSQETLNKKFHFEEMEEIEPAMVSLVEKLKENIENGEYDTLISDDGGGRIPTLVLKKILKKINPEQKLGTYFVAGGFRMPSSSKPADKEKYEELLDYLSKLKKKAQPHKALLITQYVGNGSNILKFSQALEKANIRDFDIAVLAAMWYEYDSTDMGHTVYSGTSTSEHIIDEKHEKLSGVIKRRRKEDYLPFPRSTVETLKSGGEDNVAEKELAEALESIDVDHTVEKEIGLQRNINLAREDVDLLAERVVNQVWEKRG